MPLGEWFGVTTDSNGRVVALEVQSNGLAGTIPAELGQLSKLARLWLNGNSLNGSIPDQLGNLSSLAHLALSENQLTGAIPMQLGHLSSLKSLWLSGNRLTGSIPAALGNLTALLDLDLSNNRFTGPVPRELGNLLNLTDLNLSRNRFTGSLPSELGNLLDLTQLWLDNSLSQNQLAGPVPISFANLSRLLEFSVGFTHLCAPADEDFMAWLEGIPTVYGPLDPCTKPRLDSVSSVGVELHLKYDRDLDATSVPSPADFEILVDGASRSVAGVAVRGRLVVLTLASPLAAGQAVTIGYTPGDTPLRTLSLVEAESLVAHPVPVALLPLRVEFGAAGYVAEEGGASTAVTVRLSKAPGRQIVIPITAAPMGGASAEDYSGVPASVTFASNETERTFAFAARADEADDDEDAVLLGFGSPLPALVIAGGTRTTTVTILDDPADVPGVSLSYGSTAYAVAEGGSVVVTVRLSAMPERSLEIPLTVEHGGGALAADYSGVPASVTFTVNESERRFILSARPDHSVDDGETVTLGFGGLLPPAVALADPSSATVTIHHAPFVQSVLRILYEATDGPNWNNNTNWLSEEPLAEWHGISGSTNQLVVSLSSNGLTGSIPPELGTLNGLSWLNLARNQLGGSIPPELGLLANLETLSLARNQLSGPIPAELWNLTGLRQLWLSGNEALSGSIPSEVANLASLAYLYLQETSLSGPLPSRLTELTALAVLDFSETELCAPADAAFQTWASGVSSFKGPACEVQVGMVLPQVWIAAGPSPVAEGAAATFTLTRVAATLDALTVAVSVAESGSALFGPTPTSVTFVQGDTSATLSVPTQRDQVVEADSAVTATVTAGAGYTVGAASSATVTVEDDDEAAFTVSAVPQSIAEGESATLTVAISNGVTFAEDQSVALSVSGTASPVDYSGVPAGLTLAAGASAVTAELAAEADQAEEEAETVTVAAAHAGVPIGSATVTISSVSHDPTLGALSLSGVDIGTFASSQTSYVVSVAHGTSSTTVTAKATHPRASVSILPGAEVSLAEGANEIAVTVTAEDGESTQTYTVTVTRAGLPVVSIVAVASPVSEGERAAFTVSRTGPTTQELTVQASWSYSDRAEVRKIPVLFQAGKTSKTPYFQEYDDKVVREDVTVTLTLEDGEGYTVSAGQRSAEVVLEENDVAQFALSLDPGEIAEGESATVRIGITNGVTFEEDQAIKLDFAGSTATKGTDFTVSPESPTLPAGARSVTATLDAALDTDDEGNETVTVAAAHGVVSIGSATVTIAAVSHDATLGALSLSGVDIGTFASGETSYAASVAHATSSTTVTAKATHPRASVSILPGAEVSLAEGANEIAVTVTAEDGITTKTYTVTVTRTALPVVSIVAVASPVSEGERAAFTVSRTGPTTQELTVQASWSYSDRAEVQEIPVLFQAGKTSKTPYVQRYDDKVIREDVTVTWTLEDGEGYTVSAEARSAQVVLEDNDVAQFALSLDPGEIAEGESGTVRVEITNSVTFEEDQAITFEFAGSTATKGADYTVSPESLTMRSRANSVTATVTALDDRDEENDETVSVTAKHDGETIGTATLTITNTETAPLTAQFGNMPAEHNGGEFTFDLSFSENVRAGYARIRDYAFSVSGGNIKKAQRKTKGSNQNWTVTVQPSGTGSVSITLPETTNCSSSEAICTHDKRKLSNSPSATIPGAAAALDFAHFAKGATITSEMVLVNAAPHPSRPAIYFYDTEGDPIPAESVVDLTGDLEVTEDGGLTVWTEMEPLEALTISTHGRGEPVSGSVTVLSDGPIGGVVRYSVPEIGVAGVGPGQPTSDALFPVRRQAGGIRTAAALHNLEAEAMGVRCRLMSGGVALEEVEIHLEANGQASWFIEDAFTTTDTSDFGGSVRCTAPGNGRFTAVALEMDAANRIFTTLPVVPVDPPGSGNQQTTLDFAHFANGTGITSEMVFLNPSTQPSRPAVYFYDTEGNPIAPESVVDITGDLEIAEDGALTVQTEMEPLGVLTISTHGRGPLVSGSVRVVSDGPIGGLLRFDLPGVGAGVVGASPPISDALFPVRRQEGGITTWAAIHNLESSPGLLRCDLMREGVLLDAASIPLEANGQTSWFIDQAFPGADTSDFAGSVRCDAVGEGLFSAVALEMDPGTRIFTTLPVVPVPERTDRE